MDPFDSSRATAINRSFISFQNAVGFGNWSRARLELLDSTATLRSVVSVQVSQSGMPCIPGNWSCLEGAITSIPVSFEPPELGIAVPPIDLNQTGTDPVFVALDIPDQVSSIATQSARMWIGPMECYEVSIAAGNARCLRMPPNVGGPWPVRVSLLGGQMATGSTQVSFRTALIDSIDPPFVWPSIERNYSFEIRGSSFGLEASHVVKITIGDHECDGIEWKSPTRVMCTSVLSESFGLGDVIIYTKQLASRGGERLLGWQPHPLVSGAMPSLIPTEGGRNISIFG